MVSQSDVEPMITATSGFCSDIGNRECYLAPTRSGQQRRLSMNHAWYRAAGLLLLALGVALPAHAQDERKSEISGGYQLLTLHEGEVDETLGTGWYADVAGNFGPIFAVVVQVAGNYKSYGQDETINGF